MSEPARPPGSIGGGTGQPSPSLTRSEPGTPFLVRDEETVWSGRVIRAAVVQVEGPNGESHTRDVVHHPGAVAVVPLHEDGTVTMVHQYRAALDKGVWEIPAGLRDVDGEPPEETARRELAEEVGLAAGTLEHLTRFHNSPGCSDEAVEIFLATNLSPVPDDRQGAEEQHMVVERLPATEARAMVSQGRITDAKTIIGLLSLVR